MNVHSLIKQISLHRKQIFGNPFSNNPIFEKGTSNFEKETILKWSQLDRTKNIKLIALIIVKSSLE